MPYTIQTGSNALNREEIDSIVKQVGQREYKMTQAVAIVETNALTHTFFRKDPTTLTGQSGNSIEGVPFAANFPHAKVFTEKLSVMIKKFALETNIPWEVMRGSAVDVQTVSTIGLTEGVVKSVDDYIYGELTQDATGSTFDTAITEIQSHSILLGRYWDVSSANITDDLGRAEQLIAENAHVDTSNLLVYVSPRDYRSMKKWVIDKGSQFNGFAEEVTRNGRVAKLDGKTIIQAESITASFALVLKPKTCASFFEFVPLQSTTIEDPYKSTTIRVVHEGAVGRTNPKEIVIIRSTQSGTTT